MGNLLITVDTENWYNSRLFDAKRAKTSNESKKMNNAESDLLATLEVFSELKIKGTFFVLGSLLEEHPNILHEILKDGHEAGMHAYNHDMHYETEEFKVDVLKGLKVFRQLGHFPKGYRHPYFNISAEKMNVLSEFFEYDTSLVPSLPIPGHYGSPFAFTKPFLYRGLVELPLSVFPYLRLPAATGWYLRNLGYTYLRTMLNHGLKKAGVAVLCLHTWEFTEKPTLPKVPKHVFKNTGRPMINLLFKLIESYERDSVLITTCTEYTHSLQKKSIRPASFTHMF
jgi:peptidoglycan/xylan/chitin deacetylase (PgdA/CDA1 family)